MRIFSLIFCLALAVSVQAQTGRPAAMRGVPKYQDPPFDHDLASYTAARGQTCVVGESALIGDDYGVDAAYDCVADASSWRSGVQDDGLLAIDSNTAGNIWKLDIAHSPSDPIDLTRWEPLVQNALIDTLIINLATDLGSDLYVRVPNVGTSSVDTLTWDYANLTTNLTTFYLLENDAAFVIDHVAVPTTLGNMLKMDDYITVKIGGPNNYLTFSGNHSGVLGGIVNNGWAGQVGRYLMWFDQGTANGVLLDIRANFHDADGFGINVTGGAYGASDRTTTGYFSGDHLNSGLQLNTGLKNIYLDPTSLYTDPYGVSLGWTGAADGKIYPTASEKSRCLWAQNMDELTGGVIFQYGDCSWYMFMVEKLGTSESDPFVVKLRDMWISGPQNDYPGVEIHYQNVTADTAFSRLGGGKWDPLGDRNGTNKTVPEQFIRQIYDYAGSTYSTSYATVHSALDGDGIFGKTLVNEMTVDAANTEWQNRNINIQLWDVPGTVAQDGTTIGNNPNDGSVYIGNVSYTNYGEVRLNYADTVRTGVWARFRIQGQDNQAAADGNVIRNLTVYDDIDVREGSNTLEGVTFSVDASQSVMDIDAGATITVPSGAGNGLTGTYYATRTLQITGAGDLYCAGSGTPVSLPYTFAGDGVGVCEY